MCAVGSLDVQWVKSNGQKGQKCGNLRVENHATRRWSHESYGRDIPLARIGSHVGFERFHSQSVQFGTMCMSWLLTQIGKTRAIPEPWTGCSVHGKSHLETDLRCPLWSWHESMHGCGPHPIPREPGWQGLLLWGWFVPVCCRRPQRCTVQAGSGLERGSREHDSKDVPRCMWYGVSWAVERSFREALPR